MADELTPGDETVPLRARVPGDHGGTPPADSFLVGDDSLVDDTVAIDGERVGLWEPGPRLAARVPAVPAVRASRRGGSGWFIAALIIATAIVIAVGLWLAASSTDEDAAVDVIAAVVFGFF